LLDGTVIRAAELLGQHHAGQAILILFPYCNSYPDDAQGNFLPGVAYHQTGQLEVALSALDTALNSERSMFKPEAPIDGLWC